MDSTEIKVSFINSFICLVVQMADQSSRNVGDHQDDQRLELGD